MPELFPSVSPIIEVIILFLTGGTFGGVVKYFIDARATNADIGQDLRDELRGEIDDLRSEVEDLRDSFLTERRARINAQSAAWALRKKLDLVIQMLNEIRKNEDMDALGMEEIPGFAVPTKEELRSEMQRLSHDLGKKDMPDDKRV